MRQIVHLAAQNLVSIFCAEGDRDLPRFFSPRLT